MLFKRLLRLLEFGVVQVQPRQLILVVGAFRRAFEHLLPGIDGLLQRPEIQAQIIRRQAQQGIDGGKTHVLLAVIEQRPQQQAALAAGHQPADAFDRRETHLGRLMLQVGVRQFQGHGAWVVGQFGMQPDAPLGRQVRAAQLLVQHPRGARLAGAGRGQRFAVAVLDRFGHHRGACCAGTTRQGR